MSPLISFIKDQLKYGKDSTPQIVKGFVLCVLSSSGLAVAMLLRYLGNNWSVILFFGFFTEGISMLTCYFLFSKYFNPKKESKIKSPKKEKLKKEKKPALKSKMDEPEKEIKRELRPKEEKLS